MTTTAKLHELEAELHRTQRENYALQDLVALLIGKLARFEADAE